MLDHEAGEAARDQVRCGLELSSWGHLSYGALGEGTLFSSRGVTGRAPLHVKKISCMEGDLEGGRDLRQGSQLAAREVTGCPDHPSRGDEGGGGEDTEGRGAVLAGWCPGLCLLSAGLASKTELCPETSLAGLQVKWSKSILPTE